MTKKHPITLTGIALLGVLLAFTLSVAVDTHSANADDHYDDRYDDHYDDDKHSTSYTGYMRNALLHHTEGTLTVRGIAQATADPDLVTIRLGVETEAATANDALLENSRLLSNTADAITALGIPEDDLSTSHFRIQPIYEGMYDDSDRYTSVFVGYGVSNIITVTTSQIDMATKIIDASVAAGVNNVDSVNFGLSPDTEAAIREDLIDSAIRNAMHKAELALVPLGYEIVGVERIFVDLADTVDLRDQTAFALESRSFEFTSTPVFAGDQDLTTTATITFRIGPL